MAFNKEDFTRVELPKPPSNNEVTFNTDGKITLSKDLSGHFIGVIGLGLDGDGDGYGANIYAEEQIIDEKSTGKEAVDTDGKPLGVEHIVEKKKILQLWVEIVPYSEGVDCKINYLKSQKKLRVSAKYYLTHLGIRFAGKKYGNKAITVIADEKKQDYGIVIDLTKRPLPKRKTKPKSKTTVSAPVGEQATPKTQQKSTKIVESPTGALQMKR